jgi:serine/threonine protein kinase
MLDGEAIDWDKEGVAESEVREGMQRLARVIGKRGETTETKAAPSPEAPPLPPPPPPPRPSDDRFIGDFRLVRKLGEGGMGVVYEAEQQHPRRPVALKVIRGGAHVSPDTLKLFQREAQTLARLRHPGIAALYETGATEEGLHFFAMELVRGSTLTAWLGQRPAGPLTPHEVKLRLSIFKKICDAVAYAHQKGVIHRDLKPANVLIPKPTAGSSMQDEVPDVKVLDFGLARITDSDVQATTYVTEMGKIRGTLPYMSPEQVRGNPDEIDLRTDVYALGVMLYEMMTGALPYDLSKAQIPEAVRIICEQAPKSISASFTGTRHLDADVITIAGKCLEKETSRRYQSAAALGDDIQRYLSDQTILARPPSAVYQLRKLAARHKGVFAFAATVFVLVTALAVTMTIQAVRIAKERDRANQEAETARQVSEFLEGLFKVSDPSEARGNEITAREILDAGAERIDRELKDQPKTRARLLGTMGETFVSLGLAKRADELLQGSLRANADSFGPDSVEYAGALVALGQSQSARGAYRDATALARQALSITERRIVVDDTRRLKAKYLLGSSLLFAGDVDEGTRHLSEGLEAIEASRTPDDRMRIWFLNDLAIAEIGNGRLDEAGRYLERALEFREHVYPNELDPERIMGLGNLADVLFRQGDTARARPMLEQYVRNIKAVYGANHINMANALESLAEVDLKEGRLSEARSHSERSLAVLEHNGLRRSPVVVNFLVTRAQIEEAEGNLAPAEALLREGIEIVIASRGYNSAALLNPIDVLAQLLRRTDRSVEADSMDARAAEIRKKTGQASSLPVGVNTPSSRIKKGDEKR